MPEKGASLLKECILIKEQETWVGLYVRTGYKNRQALKLSLSYKGIPPPEVSFHASLTSALDGGEWSAPLPKKKALSPRSAPETVWMLCCGEATALPQRESNPNLSFVHTVAYALR
jgi:hypothetical protein